MSDTQSDGWPTLDQPTLLDTPAPLLPPPPPPPVPPRGDRQIGAGLLLGVGAIGLVAIGLLLAVLVSRRSDPTTGTTVVITTAPTAQTSTAGVTAIPTPAHVTVARPTTTASTTTASTTTASTTTSTLPTTATMPDVSGQSEQAAATSLNQAGVLASLFFVPASDELGTVEQQAKPSGTNLPYHSHVQLNISRGPGQKADETVPNVIGSTLTDAVSTLNAAHLRLIYVKYALSSAGQAGTIVQQSPLAGGKAPQNAQVLVFLGVRPS